MRPGLTGDGPTRPLAVGRIALALLVWAELIAVLRPAHHLAHPDILLVTVVPWVSSTLLLVGFFARTSAAVTGATILLLHVWGGGIRHWGGGGLPFDTYSTWLVGLSVLLLAATPCGASLSVDRWRHPGRPERASLWGLDLVRVHVSVVFAALVVGHLTPEFLDGERLSRILLSRHNTPFEAPVVMRMLSWLWLAIEIACIAAPWIARRWLIPVGIAFALLQYPTLYTGVWSLLATVLLFLCADPDRADRLVTRLLR